MAGAITMEIILIIGIKIIPLRERLRYHCSERAKEEENWRNNRPPTEEQYDQLVAEIGEEVYRIAPDKLHLEKRMQHKDKAWRIDKQTHLSFYREAAATNLRRFALFRLNYLMSCTGWKLAILRFGGFPSSEDPRRKVFSSTLLLLSCRRVFRRPTALHFF
jgi:hypothetical protein